MTDNFFGYGSASADFDKRRHINVIFQILLMYKLKQNQAWIVPKLQYALRLPTQQAAEYICNEILSYDEHNYLNLLRERYNVSVSDFTKILSGYGCTLPENKTPAGYSTRQNQELLIQMLNSRYYMQPQDINAFMYINGVIAQWAAGMRGINMTQSLFSKYDNLWRRALSIYPTNYHLKKIEDYIISNL
ncbi:MAG: hypothetical protein J1F10_07670 [Muribaculaceae bacterium]|nr:hypothetical protein [Muribaculaceae bacterium]